MSTGGEDKGPKAGAIQDFATGENSSGLTAELTLNDGGPTLEPVVVEAIEGPGKGAHATLASGTQVVGNAPACELPVEDPAR